MGIAKAIWDRTIHDIQQAYNNNNNNVGGGGGGDNSPYYIPTMEVFSTITAEKFYQSLGFQTIQHMTVPINQDCDFPCILMRRQGSTTSNE